ncbi:MAG: 3'-5' exonuclease [Rhodococcus sp. (in: high G+C Gram-positive bacteria)]|nr:MAG: 3'-5' exonuclease [Rhodococcus sp. (in: high G+C Gram-positive bacteria)]
MPEIAVSSIRMAGGEFYSRPVPSTASSTMTRPVRLPTGHRWVVVDVETSGLRSSTHRVLSLAALALREDGSVERELVTLLNPGCDPGPVHIHNLTPQRLAGAPRFEDVAKELLELLDGRTLVAHNASFDYGFLDAEAQRAGLTMPTRQRLCTLALSRRLEIDVPNHKLSTLAAHWKVRQNRAHDAYDDALVLTEVFAHSASLAESLRLPLPVVGCADRRTVYPDRIPRVESPWRNPGRLTPEAGLFQGMKLVISGSTDSPRLALAARLADAGLDVMNSVSRQTSVVVCNDLHSSSAKVRRAVAEGIPVLTERQLGEMLLHVTPGEPKLVTTPRNVQQHRPAKTVASNKPWHGRRVLIVGRSHADSVLMRSRIVQLGAKPSVNLSAGVTDVLLLDGGEVDPRMDRVSARQLPLLAAGDVNSALEPAAPVESVAPPESIRPLSQWVAPLLARGEVIDLPPQTTSLTVNASWRAHAEDDAFEVDVVALLLGEDGRVGCDEDFLFYNSPTSVDGTVELSCDGSSEQGVRIEMAALPDEYHCVSVSAAIGGDRTFGELGPISVTVDAPDHTIASFVLDAGTTERTMHFAEIYRRAGQWRLRAVGQGYEFDLATLATEHGVLVDD